MKVRITADIKNMECDIDKNDSFEEVYHKVRKRKENYERKIN